MLCRSFMGHTTADQKKLRQRVQRIRGQLEAVDRALEEDRECGDLLQLIASVRGAMASLTAEVVEGHIRFHIVDPRKKPGSKQSLAAQQLIDVLKTYLR